MKFNVNQQDLQQALNYCQGIIEKRSTLPILSNILLNANNSKLILTATDLDIIFISLPNKYAADAVSLSLSKGLNVFCEKPYVRNVEEAKEILEQGLKFAEENKNKVDDMEALQALVKDLNDTKKLINDLIFEKKLSLSVIEKNSDDGFDISMPGRPSSIAVSYTHLTLPTIYSV